MRVRRDGPPADAVLHRPAGSLADGAWGGPSRPGRCQLGVSGIRAAALEAGGELVLETGPDEVAIVPLAGAFTVSVDGDRRYELAGRASVWAGPSDFLYLPPGTRGDGVECRRRRSSSRGAGGQRGPLPGPSRPRRGGAGRASRRRGMLARGANFASADAFAADRLIAVEVLTPGGNWGSFRPTSTMRHGRRDRAGGDLLLRGRVGPGGPGLAYQRVYGTADRPIDGSSSPSGDVVLIRMAGTGRRWRRRATTCTT